MLDFNSDNNNDNEHQQSENAMHQSSSLSQLIKRRRRRCGGVFRPVESSSSDFAVEYDWPYQRPAHTSRPKLFIDTSKANEAFFQEAGLDVRQHGSSSDSSRLGLKMWVGGRKYSFERIIETTGTSGMAIRNLATRDGMSTRSPSVYSQESDRGSWKDSKEVDRRHEEATEVVAKAVKSARWPERSSSLAVPKARLRSDNSISSPGNNSHASKQEMQAVDPKVKLTRSTSTTLRSIQQVSTKLGARTRSFINLLTRKVGEVKI